MPPERPALLQGLEQIRFVPASPEEHALFKDRVKEFMAKNSKVAHISDDLTKTEVKLWFGHRQAQLDYEIAQDGIVTFRFSLDGSVREFSDDSKVKKRTPYYEDVIVLEGELERIGEHLLKPEFTKAVRSFEKKPQKQQIAA